MSGLSFEIIMDLFLFFCVNANFFFSPLFFLQDTRLPLSQIRVIIVKNGKKERKESIQAVILEFVIDLKENFLSQYSLLLFHDSCSLSDLGKAEASQRGRHLNGTLVSVPEQRIWLSTNFG